MAHSKKGKLDIKVDEFEVLKAISTSRTEPSFKVSRSRIIIDYYSGMTVTAITKKYGTNRPLVERTIDKALVYGVLAALRDLPRSGRPSEITDDAKAWVVSIACKSPTTYGYAAETWTYSALAKHIKKECVEAGYDCLKNTGKGFLNSVLAKSNIKPHKINYYLERKDPDFEEKMASVLHVYREVALIYDNKVCNYKHTTVSYDEKPGIQAIKNIAPQLLPVPNKYNSLGRDYEYKRLGTVSLLAAIDLHNGLVTPMVCDRHRSSEFVAFLKKLNSQYPEDWRIRIILDNHSSHVSKETKKFLATMPNRFEFVFTPKHGSWLNMIEMFFSKITRSFLRNIRVESKQELVDRIYKGIEEINQEPVVFKWKYKLEKS
jgi:transposase